MAEKPRIYLDSCCFIDAVKHALGLSLESDRLKDAWHIKQLLQAHRDGEVQVFTSTLAIAECTHVEGDVSPKVKAEFSEPPHVRPVFGAGSTNSIYHD